MHPKVKNHYSKNIILFIPFVRRICPRPFVLLVFFQVVSLFSCDCSDCLLLFTIPRVRLVCLVFSPEKTSNSQAAGEAERSRTVWRDALQHFPGRPALSRCHSWHLLTLTLFNLGHKVMNKEQTRKNESSTHQLWPEYTETVLSDVSYVSKY